MRKLGYTYIGMTAGLLACCLSHPRHVAVAQEDAIDAWARWATTPKVWKGQTVAFPEAQSRPPAGERLDSTRLPLHVHAPAGTSPAKLEHALAALERAYVDASVRGFHLPYPDGGYGGTPGFDLYLAPASDAPASAAVDTPIAYSDFDAAQTYARVDPGLPPDELSACVTSAFMQAAFLGQDPAEAPSFVRASGDLAAYLFTAEPGCAQSLSRAQRAPDGGVLDANLDTSAAGALFLSMLSERHDDWPGSLLRSLWELTRQRSRGLVAAGRLRGAPDLWQALDQLLVGSAKEPLEDSFEEFAAARYFSGPRGRVASYRVLSALSDAAAVPLLADIAPGELPKHVHAGDHGLAALGSAYVRVQLAPASSGTLRVWLRGELGPRWSTIAISIGEDGRELGRMKAPPRRVPQSYLPVELSPGTAEVIVVVTHLPQARPDADRPPLTAQAFSLILDHQP